MNCRIEGTIPEWCGLYRLDRGEHPGGPRARMSVDEGGGGGSGDRPLHHPIQDSSGVRHSPKPPATTHQEFLVNSGFVRGPAAFAFCPGWRLLALLEQREQTRGCQTVPIADQPAVAGTAGRVLVATRSVHVNGMLITKRPTVISTKSYSVTKSSI